jgi:DNA mismatch repair protein MutL
MIDFACSQNAIEIQNNFFKHIIVRERVNNQEEHYNYNMGKIRVLDDATINKIAAGEVIERPSSVVKELIENSIDAGASDIRVEVIRSGKKLIRVIDNGCGMGKEDAALSFMKHATSKIGNIEDLETVRTMGFRGEALSSISAVAKVEIVTKTKEELSGTKVTVHGGK